MRIRGLIVLTGLIAACSGGAVTTSTQATTTSPPSTTAPATTGAPSTTGAPPTSTVTSTRPPPPTQPPTTTIPIPQWTAVSAPGSYVNDDLMIHIRFQSEVTDVSSTELKSTALAILNDVGGWSGAGFGFVANPASELTVILAEGARVDELCLPLETYGKVSCQNGPVVALNADRWRLAGRDWDGTVESYRTYLVNHEVGHLIGLRHPQERCPTESKISALMEPQTNNLQDCVGNGIPLDWELEWARHRPAMIGPDPAWDGPRPTWPAGS